MRAAEWNAKHPAGTPVEVSGLPGGEAPFVTNTRGDAWETIPGGVAMVLVEGRPYPCHIKHLRVIPAPRLNGGRGFASMDPAKQRAIASSGGRRAHKDGTAHQFSSDEARAAGRKGGATVSRDREHMAEIGRKGGQARAKRIAARGRQ